MALKTKFRPLSANAVKLADTAIELQNIGKKSVTEPYLLQQLEKRTTRRGGTGLYWDHDKLQRAMMELYSLDFGKK